MSTLQTMPVSQVPAAHFNPWTTPRLLRIGRITILVLDLLLLVAVWVGITAHRDAIKTVGVDTAPSIIAAQGLRAEMASMDADLANELLGSSGTLNSYEAARGRADALLLDASENITFGDAERGPLHTLQNGLGAYEEISQRARDVHASESGPDQSGTLDAYHQAQTLTDRTLLPAADDLDAVNLAELNRTYKRHLEESTGSTGFVVLMGLLLLAALVTLQMFLSRRTKRTLNPALFVASFLVLWLTMHAAHAMNEAQKKLKLAREDAFASVHTLLRARAAAFEADALESRFLLDKDRAGAEQASFQARSDDVAHLPTGTSAQAIIHMEMRESHPDGFTGYLADELNNITFPGEREAAVQTLAAWEQYLAVDAKIRQLEQSGNHAAALALSTSPQPGGADRAFDQFQKSLDQAVAINQEAFDASVKEGFDALDGVERTALIVTAIVAVLVFAGLLARLREYA